MQIQVHKLMPLSCCESLQSQLDLDQVDDGRRAYQEKRVLCPVVCLASRPLEKHSFAELSDLQGKLLSNLVLHSKQECWSIDTSESLIFAHSDSIDTLCNEVIVYEHDFDVKCLTFSQ